MFDNACNVLQIYFVQFQSQVVASFHIGVFIHDPLDLTKKPLIKIDLVINDQEFMITFSGSESESTQENVTWPQILVSTSALP